MKQLERLRAARHASSALTLAPGANALAGIRGDLFDLRAQFTVGNAGEVRFVIRGVPVVYDAAKQELVCRDRRNPLPPVNGKVRLQVLVDRTSLEIFGNDGLLYIPMAGEFAPGDRSLSLTVTDSALRFSFLEANELKSIWPKKQMRP